MSYLAPMLAVSFLILLVEILCGRHKGIYRKQDWLVIGLPAVLNPAVSRALAGTLIGSVAQKVVHLAPVPVVLVK